MAGRRTIRGFTLVELLVVIGIIALLISILLPALNRARQQANLVYCASNERQIGQLIQEYAAENHGYVPQGEYGGVINPTSETWNFAVNPQPGTMWDLLSIMVLRNAYGGDIASYKGNWAAHALKVMRDVDTPDVQEQLIDAEHPGVYVDDMSDYIGNIRVFGDPTWWDPYLENASSNPTLPACAYQTRQLSSIKNASHVACVWDNQVDPKGEQYDAVSFVLYSYWESWGSAYVNDPPFNGYNYNGAGILGTSFSLGSIIARDTLVGQKYDNRDGNQDECDMRFRHMQNTTANFLFCDGHVEPRQIGTVTLNDLSMNLH